MRPAKQEWYVGIDLGREWTLVSVYHGSMKEPETRSTVVGKDQYRIPTAVCRKYGIGKWYIGEEACRLAGQQQGMYADHLLELALEQETITLEESYEAGEVLTVFLRKVLRLALPSLALEKITRCAVTLEKLTEPLTELLEGIFQNIGMDREQLLLLDNRESFYAYAVCQQKELWMQEVLLFDYREDGIWLLALEHDRRTVPQVCSVSCGYQGTLPANWKERDQEFAKKVQENLGKKLVSAVYLTGDGFEGNWMKESLQILCRGRRAFQGRNLYTKGACYAGMLAAHQEEAKTVYFCEYKIFCHLFLKVTDGEREYMYPLAEAGENLHQLKKECRILLEGEPVLDLWMQRPGSREAVIESLELPGLSLEEGVRCRLLVQLSGTMKDKLLIWISDMGFGELMAGSGLEWEYEIEQKE